MGKDGIWLATIHTVDGRSGRAGTEYRLAKGVVEQILIHATDEQDAIDQGHTWMAFEGETRREQGIEAKFSHAQLSRLDFHGKWPVEKGQKPVRVAKE